MTKLRECPFCSSQFDGLMWFQSDGLFFVHCALCGTDGPKVEGGRDPAIAAWNRRAGDRYTVTPKGREMLGEG